MCYMHFVYGFNMLKWCRCLNVNGRIFWAVSSKKVKCFWSLWSFLCKCSWIYQMWNFCELLEPDRVIFVQSFSFQSVFFSLLCNICYSLLSFFIHVQVCGSDLIRILSFAWIVVIIFTAHWLWCTTDNFSMKLFIDFKCGMCVYAFMYTKSAMLLWISCVK